MNNEHEQKENLSQNANFVVRLSNFLKFEI